MRTSRRTLRPRPSDTDPMSLRDDTSRLSPKLPHERDETPDADAGVGRDHVARAAADLAAGRKDTDCYGAARLAFRRARPRKGH
jgi:hypothetical protein